MCSASYALKPVAGDPFPSITVSKLGGGRLTLGGEQDKWQLIYVYRGKHCPVCVRFLPKLSDMVPRFEELGIAVTAISADPEQKAAAMAKDGNYQFQLGYGLTVEQMRQLQVYISAPRTPPETDRPFAEPAYFIVRPDGTLQVVSISNSSGARPDLDFLLLSITFAINNKLNPSGAF